MLMFNANIKLRVDAMQRIKKARCKSTSLFLETTLFDYILSSVRRIVKENDLPYVKMYIICK